MINNVFKIVAMTATTKLHPDAAAIDARGGVTAVARLLGIPSAQNVWNWRKRGIPDKVLIERPDAFPDVLKRRQSPPTPTKEAV